MRSLANFINTKSTRITKTAWPEAAPARAKRAPVPVSVIEITSPRKSHKACDSIALAGDGGYAAGRRYTFVAFVCFVFIENGRER
ncbi:MAG TPA: hypothetical protein VM096_14445 [Vicinamibacterales bacterium]|nr:hypothetical protein [Vicinamibacterales bacterium]